MQISNLVSKSIHRFAAKAGLSFAIVFMVVVSSQNGFGQVHRSAPRGAEHTGKYSVDGLPTVDLSHIKELRQAASGAGTEKKRADRYSSGTGGKFPLFDPATGRSLVPEKFVHYLSQDPLPTKVSDVVVVGKITAVASHISSDGSMVYSTFEFTPTSFLKNTAPPNPTSIVLERVGGVALYPDGTKRFVGENGAGIPDANHKYILFLTKIAGETSYHIETGYGIDGGHVVALDQLGDKLEGETGESLLKQIRTKISSNQ